MPTDLRTCTKCLAEKSVDEFNRDASKKDGIYPVCRECKNAWRREYRAANPERVRAQERASKSRRPKDDRRAAAKRYRDANADAARQSSRDYYLRHRETVLKRTRVRTVARRAALAGAAARSIDLEALWDGHCGICGDELSREHRFPHPLSPSIDHIVPLSKGGGHTPENVQWAHLGCNIRKSNRLPAERAS